jgi:DNA-directed RNA polymerase specialized sigma24 family protein
MVTGGDDDDFFGQILPRAVAVARRVTGERASAEDAAVEAWPRAHLSWRRIGPLPWRDAWVLGVTTQEALRHLPRRARRWCTQPAITGADRAMGWSSSP